MDEIGEKYRASIEKASLEDLLGVLGQIDREKFPNRIEFVQREIERRKASGATEYRFPKERQETPANCRVRHLGSEHLYRRGFYRFPAQQ